MVAAIKNVTKIQQNNIVTCHLTTSSRLQLITQIRMTHLHP
jgi:hypothetical protein